MKGQLKTHDQAVETPKQHNKPCADCPFARTAVRGWIPDTPEGWLRYAHGEGRIECHTTKQPHTGDAWQCAGGAIFRSNVCKLVRDKTLLRLPRNKIIVFTNDQEFIDHHEVKK